MTTKFKKGDIVLYSPTMTPGSPKFGAVVRKKPWQLGDKKTWVTHVVGLGPAYGAHIHKPDSTIVHAACLRALEHAPTIYCSNRQWITQELFEGDFLVGYVMIGQVYWSDVEGQFTDIGWRYQAFDDQGQTRGAGPADSYESARAAVEERCK